MSEGERVQDHLSVVGATVLGARNAEGERIVLLRLNCVDAGGLAVAPVNLALRSGEASSLAAEIGRTVDVLHGIEH